MSRPNGMAPRSAGAALGIDVRISEAQVVSRVKANEGNVDATCKLFFGCKKRADFPFTREEVVRAYEHLRRKHCYDVQIRSSSQLVTLSKKKKIQPKRGSSAWMRENGIQSFASAGR